MNKEMKAIINKLGLVKLWNDDYIQEYYSSESVIDVDSSGNTRPLYNWAYYLIPEGSIFPLHKLLSDESWQYCLGGPIDLYLLENGKINTVRIGPNIFDNEKILYIVKKNTWFAAEPAAGSKYSLITHCVSPGWMPEDDIAGFYDEMIQLIPENSTFIKKFAWPKDREVYSNHDLYKN